MAQIVYRSGGEPSSRKLFFWDPYFSLLFGEVAHHSANADDETEGVIAKVKACFLGSFKFKFAMANFF